MLPEHDHRQRRVRDGGLPHELAVVRAGRGIAPWIRGIVEVPKPDQTLLISGELPPDVLANLFRSACRPPKSDLVHLAAERIKLIKQVTPQNSLLDGTIREKASRVSRWCSTKLPLR